MYCRHPMKHGMLKWQEICMADTLVWVGKAKALCAQGKKKHWVLYATKSIGCSWSYKHRGCNASIWSTQWKANKYGFFPHTVFRKHIQALVAPWYLRPWLSCGLLLGGLYGLGAMEKIIKTSKWRTLVWNSAKHTVGKVLVEEMYVVKTGCLAFGCHSLGVSSPMVACIGCTWHTAGFFSHRSSSCIHGLRNGFCHTMAHPWAGRPFWAGSSLVWPSWPSWHSLAWSLPWSSWLWWLSGPSWALSSLAWFVPWSSWSSWYWWLALAWLTLLGFLVLILGGLPWALDGL